MTAQLLLPAIVAVLAAAIGALSAIFLQDRKRAHETTSKLLDKYLDVRDEVADMLSALTSLSIQPRYTAEALAESAQLTSRLYFKYYDFLPLEVLLELNCLYLSLTMKGDVAYVSTGESAIRPLDRKNLAEVSAFVRSVSLVSNIDPLSKHLATQPAAMVSAIVINLQARRCIQSLNQHFTYRNVLIFGQRLQKATLVEQDPKLHPWIDA